MTTTAPRFIHVGTGGWGRIWSSDFLHRLVVDLHKAVPVAAVDTDPKNLLKAQVGYGISPDRCYTDARRAFAENEADFAVVVVPPMYHEDIVTLALEHGCDVLSEKPIAHSMEAAARIYETVKRSGRKMAVTMSHRFDQDKQTLERLVKSGDFGPLNYLVGRVALNNRHVGDWGSPTAGLFRHHMRDPLFIEGAVHYFDIIRAVTGSNARNVYATSWNPAWGEYEGDSTALVVAEMENGVRASFEGAMANASSLDPWENEYWRAECRDATLELHHRRLRILRGGPDDEPNVTEVPLDVRPVWMNSWLVEWFVDWLQGGPPMPTRIEDNIHCQSFMMAAVESARTNGVVELSRYEAAYLGHSGLSPAL